MNGKKNYQKMNDQKRRKISLDFHKCVICQVDNNKKKVFS